ncbi:MAG: hypothetical protein QME78_16740 [Thermodesulfobacteriota bacterium]|nr:hypothetical protein [Thermodesulfobacteriota bacterium]
MKITLEMLRERGACQINKFETLFGSEAETTLENCLLAAKEDLDLDWIAGEFLTGIARESYKKDATAARESFENAIAPAWAAFKKDKGTAFFKASLKEKKIEK